MAVTREDPCVQGELIGQRCGGAYAITKLLGEGGMGQVYLARNEMLAGKPAAVKVLLHELSRRPEALARFHAEVYATGKIDDPNIVKVFDAGTFPDGRLYMLMEYCSGGSLATLLEQRGALPIDLIVTIASAIGSALDTAHEAKIIHRDLKPANILLVQEPGSPVRGKLADFGIAKLHDAQLELALRTGTKKVIGSPGYMAPEQCSGKRGIDHRADVFAFGCVIYEMATGRRPYVGSSLFELITSVASNAPFPRPSRLRRDLPPAWDDIILAALAHRREDRIGSAKELVRRLARSIPNGEALMSYVAPRLIDNIIEPSAVTISDGIGPAATQWAAAHSLAIERRGGRGHRLGRMFATLAAGAIAGGGVIALAVQAGSGHASIRDAPAAVPHAALDAGSTEILDPLLMEVAAAIPDAAIAVAPGTATGAKTIEAPVIDAGVEIEVRPPARIQDKGELVIAIDPYAEVWIDGVSAGATPIRTRLGVGRHRVVLVNTGKGIRKTLHVKIDATPTIIEETW